MVALTRKFLSHVLPGVVRPLHILWNQVIGFFFLVIALVPVPGAIRAYNESNMPRFLLSVTFIVIMGSFGVSSFWRARKISRT
jgi:drug/metabolite transporter (DMT)-like permease